MKHVITQGGEWLLMQDDAMAELGWNPGQQITDAQVWDGISANARSLCREMDRRGMAPDQELARAAREALQ